MDHEGCSDIDIKSKDKCLETDIERNSDCSDDDSETNDDDADVGNYGDPDVDSNHELKLVCISCYHKLKNSGLV